jgi:prevent-host-death family protein
MKNLMLPLNQVVTVSKLQKDYKTLVNRVKRANKALYITRHGNPEVIMTSLEDYENLKRKARQAEVKRTLDIVEEGRKEYKSGKTKRLTSAKKLK